MVQASEAIERFFRSFESNLSNDHAAGNVSLFSEVFIAASPQGVQAVHAGEFALALPKRKQLFDRIGCRSTELVSLNEQRLDARYVLANTQWKITFALAESGTQEVVVDSVYIVDTGGDSPKIILYLANQDIMQVLKDRGLLPA
jgi:hypothetical protein